MSLHWFDSAEEMLKHGTPQATMNVIDIYSGPFAMVNDGMGSRDNVELVNARVSKVMLSSDTYVTVVLCRVNLATGKPEWTIYCGDEQVSGKFSVDAKKLAGKIRTEGKLSMKLANALESSDYVGKVPAQDACGFFRMLERGLKQTPPVVKLCSHTQAALNQIQKADLESMANDLVSWNSGADVSATALATGPMSEEEEAFYDAAFVQHVLLAGERGSGKTYLGRSAADKFDAVYLEMQMHPSMEPWEFRAHDRSWNGKTYTVLGKLAEAVYWIQKGKKVVLAMDEFLNMNPVYATTINTPLTLTANDTYLIETGRIIDQGDGIGTVETVEVPSDMLWVVASTNIGARYGLDKIAPSVRARFLIILMNTNPERTKTILEKNLSERGMPLELAEMFEKFLKSANQAVLENTLDEEATTRLACQVVRAVHKKALRDKKSLKTLKQWVPAVKTQMMREIAQVVNFELGPLDETQAALYKTLVDTCFKAK